MRCDCCNRVLNDYEATLRHAVTMEFMNTCNRCLEDLNIPTVGRPDLSRFEEAEEMEEELFDEEDEDN